MRYFCIKFKKTIKQENNETIKLEEYGTDNLHLQSVRHGGRAATDRQQGKCKGSGSP